MERMCLALEAWVQVARVGHAEDCSVFTCDETGWMLEPSALDQAVLSRSGGRGSEIQCRRALGGWN